MKIRSFEEQDYKSYLKVAKKGVWPQELITIGFPKPILGRNQILYDWRLTGELCVYLGERGFPHKWGQMVRIAEAYSRSRAMPHCWNHNDWTFLKVETDEAQQLKAQHYTEVGRAIIRVNWHAKKWGRIAYDRYCDGKYDGRHSATAAKNEKNRLYGLKEKGLLYLLRNNAAQILYKNDCEDTYTVVIPTGHAHYYAHTNWFDLPEEFEDYQGADNCRIVDGDLTLHYQQNLVWANIPQSIKLLKELNEK